MKKIRIAQIGAGHDHASHALRTLKLQKEIYELVGYAVVEGDEEAYENFRQAYEGVKKMTVEEILNISDLDAVVIETEDRRLTEYAIRAAERGLHIHIDKPGSESDEAFDRLIDLVKENQLVFHVGYMYRYNPAVMEIKEKIKAGKMGEIYSVEAQMSCLHPPQKRQWLKNYPGGMLYYLGCHLIDLVYGICGKPDEILPLSVSVGTDGVDAQDFGMAVFKYKNGVSFVKSTAVEVGGFERRQLVVCGTKGTIELKPFEWLYEDLSEEYKSWVTPQTTCIRDAFKEDCSDWHKKAKQHDSPVYGRYDAMFRAFAAYVRNEKQNPYTYEYERELHKIVLRACGVM